MPKIYDNPEINERRLNEDIWFQINQPLLLWLSNTQYGRDLLHIPQMYGEIVHLKKNSVCAKITPTQYLSDFRIGSKWANVIRYRWEDFKKCEKWYYDRFDPTKHINLYPRTSVRPFTKPIEIQSFLDFYKELNLVATTTTVYPDPDPETTTVDGTASRISVDESFSTIRGGAGNSSSDSSTLNAPQLKESGTSGQWQWLRRGYALFDTSSIPDADSISATVFSLYGSSAANDVPLTAAEAALSIVSGVPASNTAIVDADYAIANFGSSKYCTDYAYASFSSVAYNDMTFNATGIAAVSKTGVTKLGFRYAVDVDNGSPTSNGNLDASAYTWLSADNAGTTNDPKLVVTHAVDSPPSGRSMMGMGT